MARYERSGLGPAAFCRQHRLVHSTFSRWVREYGSGGGKAEGKPYTGKTVEFVKLTQGGGSEEHSELVVRVGGSSIVVRRGFDAALLRDVVAALSVTGGKS